MRHTASVTLVLTAIWLANSGHYDALLLSFGAFSVVLVLWISHRMDVVDHESQPIHLTAKLPFYYLWLFQQIIRSNIDVVSRVWRGRSAISPQFEKVPAEQKTDIGRVIYANSINLTPGTLSVEVEDDYILVHSLSREGMAELKRGEMGRRVCGLEE
ncbi:Na+/H+ antiporter subunit E [Spongiibacter sp.]|uniref:Na+/H+ antiporter subunit E n=1 Tax=Spongiibacter sp. TaxID=2024860 RepID=UPI00356841A8